MGLVGVFDTVALQRFQVVPVAQLSEELFLDHPVAFPSLRPILALQVPLNVVLNAVVGE